MTINTQFSPIYSNHHGPGSQHDLRTFVGLQTFSERNSGVMSASLGAFVRVLATLPQPPPVRKCMSSH